jgi:hypothetical protein
MRTSYELSDWQHYLSYAEIDLLKDISLRLPTDPDVLCIGAGAGTCTLAVLEERPDALYYSVDIRTTEQEWGTNEHLRLAETPFGESGHVIRIWGDSKIVGKRWRVPLDLLIIDGDHSELGVAGDASLWIPHLNLGGYVIFHDYHSPKWPHVAEIVNALPPHIQQIAIADTFIALQKS